MKQHLELLKCMIRSKVRDQKGATMVEYALMAALIAVVCVVAVQGIGTQSNATFQRVETAVTPPAAP